MKTLMIRGVPMKLQQDGWWLNAPPRSAETRPVDATAPWQLGLLVALIAAGDVLMWGTTPGLSLAVFAGLCVAAALLMWPRAVSRRTIFLSVGMAVLAILPIVELVQPVSVLILMTGLPISLAVLAGCRPNGAFRFWWMAPVFSLREAYTQLFAKPQDADRHAKTSDLFGQLALGWALPIGVGLIFAGLLLSANPVLDGALRDFARVDVPSPARVLFWSGLALLIWPTLVLTRFAPLMAPGAQAQKHGPYRLPRVVNAPAIARSLVLFNAMFALQNGFDLLVLLGGAGLPDGMSFAQYAHRGAYPLVILALLSGAFALLARPFITGSPALRALLLIWVAQTLWLTVSSMLRLELYVETYGLTHLRLAAAIWMALVLTGLALTLWQIARSQSNAWLLQRVLILGAATLYVSSFLNFDAMIARYNLTHDVSRDVAYLCGLSESALPAIAEHAPDLCHRSLIVSQPEDWREWGFRNARTRHKLMALAARDDFQ